jgi:hypothetical protein
MILRRLNERAKTSENSRDEPSSRQDLLLDDELLGALEELLLGDELLAELEELLVDDELLEELEELLLEDELLEVLDELLLDDGQQTGKSDWHWP